MEHRPVPKVAVSRFLAVLAGVLLLLFRSAYAADPLIEGAKVLPRPLLFPCDVSVDGRGVTFLLDSGNRAIVIFSPSGEFLREIAGRGIFRDPTAIAVTAEGTLLVADGEAGRVLEIDLSGKVRREFLAGKGSRITGVGSFGGTVYAVDNRNDRVVVFRRDGKRTEGWGSKGDRPGEFHAPFRLVVDVSGRVFVTDVMNARVQWFSPFGQHLGTLKRFGAGRGVIFRPSGLSLDARGRIWVADSYTGLVQLFDEKGNFIQAVNEGDSPKAFGDPVGIAVSTRGIWVADQKKNRFSLYGHH